MEKDLFAERLRLASERCLVFTRTFVSDTLPEEGIYRVFPNKHGEGKVTTGDAEVFPQDSLPRGQFFGPWDAAEVVGFLWRNGKAPEWVNISVGTVENNRTVFVLWCCGHFTALPANLYHQLVNPSGAGEPFSVHGPIPPKGWQYGDDRFTLAEAQHYEAAGDGGTWTTRQIRTKKP